MSPVNAWLYLDRMDLSRYWPHNAGIEWDSFIFQFREGRTRIESFSVISPRQREAFKVALEAESYLPVIPSIDVPQPVSPDLIPFNDPDENAPVLVTANNAFTLDVLASVWAQGTTPAWFLLADCEGNTVDMSLVFGKFTPEALLGAIEETGLTGLVAHRTLTIPGLAAPLQKEFTAATGWNIEIGPVCAAELPLFLGKKWQVSAR